jgi:iron complex transport system substrate-binding protein
VLVTVDALQNALDRRRSLTGSAGALGLAALAACSAPAAAPPPTSRDFAVGDAVVQIPVDPKRVVTISTFPQDAMFDLGKDPVGVYDPGEVYILAEFLDRWRAITKISGGTAGGGLDLERIAGLTPDLIIGIDAQQAPLDKLAAIAPTVLLPFADSPTIWADLAGRTADAVGRTETVSALGKRFADRVARIRETRADVLGRVRIDIVQGGFDAGTYWLYGADSTFGGLLTAVGARLGTASAGVTGGNRAVSLEEISLLRDADALFILHAVRWCAGQPRSGSVRPGRLPRAACDDRWAAVRHAPLPAGVLHRRVRCARRHRRRALPAGLIPAGATPGSADPSRCPG